MNLYHLNIRPCTALLVTVICIGSTVSASPDRMRPNIVLVYVDDMGIGDSSAYADLGNNPDSYQIDTPNMERLAAMGTRFTDVHSTSALCSASRLSLLTGRYSFRSDLKHSAINEGQHIDNTLMTQAGNTRKTVANLLQDVGYKTYGVGKWHLGVETDNDSIDLSRTILEGPKQVGFDNFVGVLGNPGHDFKGHMFDEDVFVKFATTTSDDLTTTPLNSNDTPATNWVVDSDDGELQFSKLTQRHLNAAKTFLSHHSSGEVYDQEPFFLYYSSHSNHAPHYTADAIQTDADGTPDSITLTGNTLSGDPIRIITEDRPHRSPRPIDPLYPNIQREIIWPKYYEEDDMDNQIDNAAAARARMVQENDVVLGELIDFLEATNDPRNEGKKLVDNTLIIFTSDNGANLSGPGVGGLEQASDGQSVNLRGFKKTPWEGGTRVPFLAAWAGEFQAGMTSDALFGQQDLYATFADITNQQLEPVFSRAEASDSESVLDALQGNASGIVRNRDLIYKHEAGLIIRRGNLKLIATESDFNPDGDRVDPGGISSGLDWQDLVMSHFFDLSSDLGEQVDLVNDPAWQSVRNDMFEALQAAVSGNVETGFTRGIVGDVNHDETLNVLDWLALSKGTSQDLSALSDLAAYQRGDLDGNFIVDASDISIFKKSYDYENGDGAFLAMVASIPEPTTSLLVLTAFLATLGKRKSHLMCSRQKCHNNADGNRISS